MTQTLYHTTSLCAIESIAQNGLNACSYFSIDEGLTNYYMLTIRDEEKIPVVIAVELESLSESHFSPDNWGICEPITSCLDLDEDEINEAWEESDKTWKDCLEIVLSVRYDAVIPVHLLSVIIDTDTGSKSIPFTDFLERLRLERTQFESPRMWS